uniref:Potassium channel tetramerisation-type BTB domain-containing protein n=1 Tax=Arcella intermedia TaxID=1963864 RepID=A0A6B2LE84_9EUKA
MLGSGKWQPDQDGEYYIDRDPAYFPKLITYMRTGLLPTSGLDSQEEQNLLQMELDYYQLPLPPSLAPPPKVLQTYRQGEYQSWAYYGYMFDLEALEDIVIERMSFVSREAGEHVVSLYYSNVSFRGIETNEGAWKVVCKDKKVVFPSRVEAVVGDQMNIRVEGGKKVAFYVCSPDDGNGGIVSAGSHSSQEETNRHSHFILQSGPTHQGQVPFSKPGKEYQCTFLGAISYFAQNK